MSWASPQGEYDLLQTCQHQVKEAMGSREVVLGSNTGHGALGKSLALSGAQLFPLQSTGVGADHLLNPLLCYFYNESLFTILPKALS